MKMNVSKSIWKHASACANNLSELELTLGEVGRAVEDAKQSVIYADRSGDAFERMSRRTIHAEALHQAGHWAEAETRFREAELIQTERQPERPWLYSLSGFRYCDLLLSAPERVVWQHCIFEAPYLGIQGIRISGQQDELPKALLTRAWCACAEISFFANSNQDKTKSIKRAQEDLDEAWEIAERGLMKLYMAEILLSRARLFGMRHDSEQHLYEGTEKDLAEARKLIVICGYGRRQGELEDAEKALAQRA